MFIIPERSLAAVLAAMLLLASIGWWHSRAGF